MNLTFWLILMAAFIGQTVFLFISLIVRPLEKRLSNTLLMTLLFIVFCILVSNSITASYLFKEIMFPAKVTRGMVLLIGPIIYCYVKAATDHTFKIKWVHIFHLLPYLMILAVNTWTTRNVSDEMFIGAVEELIAGKSKIQPISAFQFILYPIHIITYTLLSYLQLKKADNFLQKNLTIPIKDRINWLRIILLILILNAIVFIGIATYTLITGTYGIQGNIFYTITVSLFVYAISYQAIHNNQLLAPGFDVKYKTYQLSKEQKDEITIHLYRLLEEKIYEDPELSLSGLSQKIGTQPHILSRVINEDLNKTFTELLNEYRINIIKKKMQNGEHETYSIMGIASKNGFKSKSAFNTAFKKYTGLTPLQYIDQLKL